MTVPNDGECPFNVGDTVFYRPSARGVGLSVMLGPEATPKIGQSVKVAKIIKGMYVAWEGLDHPSAGIYWTEFSLT